MTAIKRTKLEKLAREMVKVFEWLGNDSMARISARDWHKYFKRKLDRL